MLDKITQWWDALEVSQNLELGLDILTPLTIIGSLALFSSQIFKKRKEEELEKRRIEKLKRTRSSVLENLFDITSSLGEAQVSLVGEWNSYKEKIDEIEKQLAVPTEYNFATFDQGLDKSIDSIATSIDSFYRLFKAKHFSIFPTLSAMDSLEKQIALLEERTDKSTAKTSILQSMYELESHLKTSKGYQSFFLKSRNIRGYIFKEQKKTLESYSSPITTEQRKEAREVTKERLKKDNKFTYLIVDLFTQNEDVVDNYKIFLNSVMDEDSQVALESHVKLAREMVTSSDGFGSSKAKAWVDTRNKLTELFIELEFEIHDLAKAIQRFMGMQSSSVLGNAINSSSHLMIKLSALCSLTMNETHKESFSVEVENFSEKEHLGYALIERIPHYEFSGSFNDESFRWEKTFIERD